MITDETLSGVLAFIAVLSVAAAIASIGLAFYLIQTWTVVHLQGARRLVFVGMHGLFHRCIVLPHPLQNERTTMWIGLFVRAVAFVDTDRDDTDFSIPIELEGAPASTESNDVARCQIRVSWSVNEFIPFYDLGGQAGDHGFLPQNIRFSRALVSSQALDRTVTTLFEQPEFKDPIFDRVSGPVPYFVSGPATICLMNRYTEGEHIDRLYEMLIEIARALLPVIDSTQWMRVSEPGGGVAMTLDVTKVYVRGTRFDIPATIDRRFHNLAELQQIMAQVLTYLTRMAMLPFGVFVNDCTPRSLHLPPTLTAASRRREAARQQAAGAQTVASGLADGVRELVAAGVSEDIAMLALTGVTATESGAGPFAALLSVLQRINKP